MCVDTLHYHLSPGGQLFHEPSAMRHGGAGGVATTDILIAP
jgi:hypothetical protein